MGAPSRPLRGARVEGARPPLVRPCYTQQDKQAIRNNKTNKNFECKYYINSIYYTVK